MAKRLGNISKSSFRFLREASLYAYAGIAILGAFYLTFLAFTYKGEITELQPDFRSDLIADSRIDDLPLDSDSIIDAGIASSTSKPSESAANKNNMLAIANQGEKVAKEPKTASSTAQTPSKAPPKELAAAKKPVTTTKSPEKAAAKTNVNNKARTTDTTSKPDRGQTTSSKSTQTTLSPAKNTGTSPGNASTSTPSTKYQWVLKSFNNPEFASNWVGKFKEMGINTNVVKVRYDGKTWYRVSHGRYSSKEAARADKSKLPKIGDDDYWISSVK